MGCIFKKSLTRPLPANAEILERKGEKIARWKTAKGITRTEMVITGRDGSLRISSQAKVYTARFRDAGGRMRDVPTDCRDKAAAMQVLGKLQTEAEKIRVGLISPDEAKTVRYAGQSINEHMDAYLEHLCHRRVRGRKISGHYRRNVRCRMERLIREGQLHRLNDLTDTMMRHWLAKAEEADLAPATRNEYLVTAHAFCNWAVDTNRLVTNPLTKVEKAEAKSDARHKRRALTVEEVGRLLEAARLRPIAELGRERVKHGTPKKGRGRTGSWSQSPLTQDCLEAAYGRGCAVVASNPKRLRQLQQLGRERSLFYLVAVTTGLRKGEQTSLTVGQVNLDIPNPHIELFAKDSKSGSMALIPLREDVADQIRNFLNQWQKPHTKKARKSNRTKLQAPYDQPLFKNPPSIRVFDKDLLAAGLAEIDKNGKVNKSDKRGRILDIHALRHTFATHLSMVGVTPRVAQAALRHSRIELTMGHYTDPALLDVSGAVAALPSY